MSTAHISHGDTGKALRKATAIVDVRTPAEFAKGAVTGARSIPLFEDGERAEIGTIYKQIGKQEAIQAGLEFVGGRLAEFIRAFEPCRGDELLVYCARGGMRSASVVSLLNSLGYNVQQLAGGYKAYRNYLLDALERTLPPRQLVIHGRTGVGKTRILHQLPNTLDLEGLAQHRSSLFGAVNLEPRTQQQFESELLGALQGLDFARPVWVEGESRKVGNVTLPSALRAGMQAGTCVLVTASLQKRIERIIAEYGGGRDAATLAQLEAALGALTPFFGGQRIAGMTERLRAGDLAAVVETLLVDYYDPRYLHAMRDYSYALEVSSENLHEAVAALRKFGPTTQSRGEAAVANVANARL
ncbi:MAG: tRNA 2-selenouridine(34) synthase MnmH [SAR324 cluster bacterium]|nr:tRNA 2-selenouridine(34) synthase MnmH [SAR324 cluster bacterium]